jgi:tetratricopeptide (TPR) repeat protein
MVLFIYTYMYRSFGLAAWLLMAPMVLTEMPVTKAVGQTRIAAKSAVEVGRIAKAITVEIKVPGTDNVGSGILLQQQGDVYTVLTAGHVAEKGAKFTLKTADGQVHQSIAGSVRLTGNNIDLGVMKFRSSNKYVLAKIGTSNSLESGAPIYVAGFPEGTYAIDPGTFNFTDGKVIGNATKGNAKGYSLIYSNTTRPGMSGGPVLNENGELVAIHGQGDREGVEGRGPKTGRNLGIVVERYGQVAVALGTSPGQQIAALPATRQLNASDYLLAGDNKFQKGNVQGALAAYSQAIIIDPKYSLAYSSRGYLKGIMLDDTQGGIADYNQAIALDPKNPTLYEYRISLKKSIRDYPGVLVDYSYLIALEPKEPSNYRNRAGIRRTTKDYQGALADYNYLVTVLDTKYSGDYRNRALLKEEIFKDYQGALTDYNRAIVLTPESRNFTYYYAERARLKEYKLKDYQGALADYDQALAFGSDYDDECYAGRAALKAYRLKDYRGALADYNQLIIYNSQMRRYGLYFLNGYYLRAQLHYFRGDKASALADFGQVVKSSSSDEFTRKLSQGVIDLERGDSRSAIKNFNQLAQPHMPSGWDWDIYMYRGLAYFREGNKISAITDWKKAIQLYDEAHYPNDHHHYVMIKKWLKSLG